MKPKGKARARPTAARKRPRRAAYDARREILDAAEKRLVEGGPDAIRLQQLARDVGISHPAILHHFGSREGLVEEVVKRAFESLEAEVISAFAEIGGTGAPTALQMIERAERVLVHKGHGRAMAWLLLSGHARPGAQAGVRAIAEAAHRRRGELDPDERRSFEDTLFRTMLVGLVLVGEAVAGPSLRRSAGLGADAGAARRFREWLARLATTPVADEAHPR